MAFVTQKNVVTNRARHLLFFEGYPLIYNWKTLQWTRPTSYVGFGLYSIYSETSIIGLVRFSAGSVDLQEQLSSYPSQTAVIRTASPNINQGGRAVVTGVRPITNGGTWSVRVGTLDDIDGTVAWSTTMSVNSRSNMANFRAEGRYHRVEISNTDGFTNCMGAEIEFTPHGKV